MYLHQRMCTSDLGLGLGFVLWLELKLQTHPPTMLENDDQCTIIEECKGGPEPVHTVPVVPQESNMRDSRNETYTMGTSWSGQEVKWRGTLARDDGVVTVGICAMDKKV